MSGLERPHVGSTEFGFLTIRDEHGPGGPPGPARRGPRAGPGRGLPWAGPGRRLVARTFQNFRKNKQRVWPSLQLTVVCSTSLSDIFNTMQFKHSRLKEITTCLQQI